MTDDEIRDSARGMALSWLAECALMLRVDQPPDQQGLDAYARIVDRHIDALLDIRRDLALLWGWPAPPAPFPFPDADTAAPTAAAKRVPTPWELRAAATGGGPCSTCGNPLHTHVCLSCSPDSRTPGPGCVSCRHTGMDQTPCLPPEPKERP